MSLLDPSVGEVVDRLSIIALKQAEGNQAEHLEEERKALEQIFGDKVRKSKEELEFDLSLVLRLGAVNAFIWHREDEIRRLSSLPKKVVAVGQTAVMHLAFSIRKLADHRHHLIAEIDRIFGEARAGKEKSWMKGEGE